MVDKKIRPERVSGSSINRDMQQSNTVTEPEVDIHRTVITSSRDAYGRASVTAAVPMNRALHWGPVFGGLMTSMITSTLLGALFLGLGFNGTYGLTGGLNGAAATWGVAIAMAIGVFVGAIFCGYVSDVRTQVESMVNGFMTGVMTLMAPLLAAAVGLFSLANTAALAAAQTLPRAGIGHAAGQVGQGVSNAVPSSTVANIQTNVVLAADNAWQVFILGVVVLALGTIGGYVGKLVRERTLANEVKAELQKL